MATRNITRYFPRVWQEEDDSPSWEHQHERNMIILVVVAIIVFAVTHFTTYCVERLLLLNFPSPSRKWCFTSATEKYTKLQRAQHLIIKIAAGVALVCRWPLGIFVSFHLWQTVTLVGAVLSITELALTALLGLAVGFIRVAHHFALITGWEHPDSTSKAFSPNDYSKKHRQFVSPPVVAHGPNPAWSSDNNSSISKSRNGATSDSRSSSSSSSDSISFDETRSTIKGKGKDNAKSTNACFGNNIDATRTGTATTATNLIDANESSFMGFSPMALTRSTWLKTRIFANSVFSNSTTSTSSRDSFGGPSARRSGSLKHVQDASDQDAAKMPDLLTGTPR